MITTKASSFFAKRWWPLASLGIALLAVVWVMTLPRPSSLVSVTSVSEIVTLSVANPDAGAFALKSARNAKDGACYASVFIKPNGGPNAPNDVRYQRLPDGALVVSVRGPTVWDDADGKSHDSHEIVVFRLSSADATCRSAERVRLPAAGLLQIGAEPRNATDVDSVQPILLQGALSIFGRAIERIGPITLPSLPFAPGALYPAQSVELLPGSRLAGARTNTGETTSWWGHVDADLQDPDNALVVRASTNADAIEVFPPTPPPLSSAAGSSEGAPDRLSITLAAQLSNDPNIVWIGAALAALLGILGFFDRITRTSTREKD
jgi:hypothetical protein